jgi:hypothetical protein
LSAQKVVKELELNEDKTVIRSFDSLPQIKYLDSIAISDKKRKRFNSILGCLGQLAYHENDIVFINNIHLRLIDIATTLHAENHPIILIGGSECGDYIGELKLESNTIEISYLCTSGGCITLRVVEDAKDVFNKQTKKLLGFVEPNKEIRRLTRKKKKQ